jgi:hypothetical protein
MIVTPDPNAFVGGWLGTSAGWLRANDAMLRMSEFKPGQEPGETKSQGRKLDLTSC